MVDGIELRPLDNFNQDSVSPLPTDLLVLATGATELAEGDGEGLLLSSFVKVISANEVKDSIGGNKVSACLPASSNSTEVNL